MDSPLCQNSLQDHFLSIRCTSWHKVLAGGFADADVADCCLGGECFPAEEQRSTGWRKHGLSCPYFAEGQSIFLRALEECFDFSGIFRTCRSDLGCSEQSLKVGRAANSQDFIASSLVFLKSQFLESCD